MRIIAAIYLTIVLANFGLWLANGVDHDIFPTAYSAAASSTGAGLRASASLTAHER